MHMHLFTNVALQRSGIHVMLRCPGFKLPIYRTGFGMPTMQECAGMRLELEFV